jgi:peroxiredoxin
VKLSEDLTPYDENDSIISKDLFLREICTGNYLPVKYKANDSLNSYKLYRIENKDTSITSTIVMFGNLAYQFFRMEGKPLPGFNFMDLKGRVYNPQTCKGKVVVLNFWFIGCTSCVEEMPALNKIVASYKDRDVLFVSITPNNPDSLKNFLEKHPFAYSVIPYKKKYVIDTLNIKMFPTQMIVDRNGLIAKVPEDFKQMEIELQKELLK